MEEAAIFFTLLLCLVFAVIALLIFCRLLQHFERKRFNPKYSSIRDPKYTSLSETNLAESGGPSGSGVATAGAGGFVILPMGRHHQNRNEKVRGKNGKKKSGDKPDYAQGGDDVWTRKDSQNEGSFADRKEDPWVCRHDSGKSGGGGIVIAASVPPPSTDKDKDKTKEAESKQEASAPTPEKIEGSAKIPEEEILYDEDGNPIVNPKSQKLNDLTVAAPVIAGESLISTIATVEPGPAAAPKVFSTAGFWEAQEAAKLAEKYGSGGDTYNFGSSNYDSGTSGYGNDSSAAGWGSGDNSYGVLDAEKNMNGGWGDSSEQ